MKAALAVGVCLGAIAARSEGSVVSSENASLSLATGRQRATDDWARQLKIHAPSLNATLEGTATPISATHSLINYHYFSGLVNNGIGFSMSVARGPSHAEVIELGGVSKWERIADDVVLLTHGPVASQSMTVSGANAGPIGTIKFGTAQVGDILTITGYGDYATFGGSGFQRDGQARTWTMRVINTSDPLEWSLSALNGGSLAGGAWNMDSSSLAVNSNGEAVGFVRTASVSLGDGLAFVGLIPFQSSSGLGATIEAQLVPEAGTTAMLLMPAAAGLLGRRRHHS